MPAILNYTPRWLSRPSPGFAFFTPTGSSKLPSPATSGHTSNATPLRTTAVRGTEVFHVAGNELRWTDLCNLRQQYEAQDESNEDETEEDERPPYRVLKVPGSLKIKRLTISPDGTYLAIVTSYTIHIAILPNSAHLSSKDTGPLKLRSFQLGPTTHVVECAPIAEVLWHPLGFNGSCLVTVTEDALVRVWELDRDDRGSFESPKLAVDLKKLANAHSAAEDCSPSRYGTRKGFSPDNFEMEVAAACFGNSEQDSSHGWGSMTLWVAMKEGDVYVLCPLLPSIWQAPASVITTLVRHSRLDNAALLEMGEVSKGVLRAAEQQNAWLSEIEGQLQAGSHDKSSDGLHTFRRPEWPLSTPKFQGPFHLSPDPDQIFDIVDIHSLTVEPMVPDGSSEDWSEDDEKNGIEDDEVEHTELICLATSDGKVHICLSLSAIEPQWLPQKKGTPLLEPDNYTEDLELLVIESIALTKIGSTPVFTSDVNSLSRVFITHAEGVNHLDLTRLASRIQEEFCSGSSSGVDFRVQILVENGETTVDHLFLFTSMSSNASEPIAVVNLLDPDLGHFVIACRSGQPQAAALESSDLPSLLEPPSSISPTAVTHLLEQPPPRQPYVPPNAFWDESALKNFLETHVHSRTRQSLTQEIRLSPSTLKLLMDAHRILSAETHRLGLAASDLFARAERLHDEFREQLRQVKEAADLVDSVCALDDADDDDLDQQQGTKAEVENRVVRVKARQEELHSRYVALRRRVGRMSGRPLGERERAWSKEVQKMEAQVLLPGEIFAEDGSIHRTVETEEGQEGVEEPSDILRRLDALNSLKEELSSRVYELVAGEMTGKEKGIGKSKADNAFKVALERRRASAVEIEELLERQSALVEGTKEKLERLQALMV